MSLLVTDVAYTDEGALAAGIWAPEWSAREPEHAFTVPLDDVAAYTPGAFYRRELPCLLALVDALPRRPDCIVVDGHAWLGTGRPGLGAHLYDALQHDVLVVGVAKNRFAANDLAVEVRRGMSTKPLFVTACGWSHDAAAEAVRSMHGPYRVPLLLQLADALSRGRGVPGGVL